MIIEMIHKIAARIDAVLRTIPSIFPVPPS